jgi:rhodanese-related sulfurtransferase
MPPLMQTIDAFGPSGLMRGALICAECHKHMKNHSWTEECEIFTVQPMNTVPALFSAVRPLALVAAMALSSAACAQGVGLGLGLSEPVSAHATQQALERGATVLDVRSAADFATGHLPGAVSLPAAAGLTEAAHTARLAQALSAAGVDVSREVVLVGGTTAGELAQAQALYQRLAQVASGRVLWLVGGSAEWAATGRPLDVGTPAVAKRLAVPQHLVSFQSEAGSALNAAGAGRRSVSANAQNLAASSVRLF